MSDEMVSGRRAARAMRDADSELAAAPESRTPGTVGSIADGDERRELRLWSGPVSVRQAASSIAVDDALVAPTDYQTAAHEVIARDVIAQSQPKSTPRRVLGVLALVIALGGVVAEAAGIGVASAGDDLLATVLAVIAIALTALGAVLGVVAIFLRRGRLSGAAAAVLGILGNPLLLVLVLGALADAVSLN